jgi:FkbM family methyltransferase
MVEHLGLGRAADAFGAKVVKAALLLSRPAWSLAAVQGVAATTEHRQLAGLVRPATVIDIGANKGQFTIFALGQWRSCRVIAFEPLTQPMARARRVTAIWRDRVRLVCAAIGQTKGQIDIRIASRDDSSSILPITAVATQVFGVIGTTAVERVLIGPLDDFVVPAELVGPVLLKLDVQGYELQALQGCESLLPNIAAVYVEQSFVPLYEGQACAAEVAAYLQGMGFVEAAELNVVSRPPLGKVQSDCLFVRAE